MQCRYYFYPRPPRGGRPGCYIISLDDLIFLSTPSARRATHDAFADIHGYWISIHALREEGDMYKGLFSADIPISIHALREEGDWKWSASVPCQRHFYPRPPRGGRQQRGIERGVSVQFLSTPSARRATRATEQEQAHAPISIHALREEGDIPHAQGADRKDISIHALREEGDSKNGEKHLRFCFIIKRSAQIWKSFFQNIRKNSCNLHRTA